MRIAFFTEGGWKGKVQRDHRNMRTDSAWECALQADHVPLNDVPISSRIEYDLGIIIVPKKDPARAYKRVESIRAICDKVATMQEGPTWNWQDWEIPDQVEYFHMQQTMDILFVHNELDKKNFRGMFKHDRVEVLPTLMIEDAIIPELLCDEDERSGVMIGGNFVSWYGGFTSYSVALEFELDISAPSMGRKQAAESNIQDINYLPYMEWAYWIGKLSNYKYAVHLMRTHAAGTFALNCAYLGIPCIGFKGLDTQELCHPNTTVPMDDLHEARRVIRHLKKTPKFYEHCSSLAKKRYKQYFGEDVFLKKINSYLYTNSYEDINNPTQS